MAPTLGPRKAYRSTRVSAVPPLAASTVLRVGKSTRAKADAALRLARTLARNTEVKVFGETVAGTSMLAGPSVVSLVDIAANDGDGQRTGVKITAKRLDLKLRLGSYVQSNITWRVLVVQDMQTSATAPVYSDVVNGNTTLGAFNPVNQDRFKILADRTVHGQTAFLNQDIANTVNISIRRFAQGGLICYSGTGATTCDKNKIWLMVTADYAAAGNPITQGWAAGEADYSMLGSLYFSDA